jgi:hypothetical protein
MFTNESLRIGNLSTAQMNTVASNLLSVDISYSMDMSNQLTFTVIDPGFEMASNNYFQVGRDVVYQSTAIIPIRVASDDTPIIGRMSYTYEISRVSVAQSGSQSPVWTVEALPKAVQQMKRDKKPGKISGSGYTFAYNAAAKYGLRFVGENSAKIKSASKNSGDGQADSVWTVLTGIASNSQYVCFVMDGTLYFGSEKWLMYKWGTEKQIGKIKTDKSGKPILNKKTKLPERHPTKRYIPMEYTRGEGANSRKFEVLMLPNLSKGENDPMEGGGSLVVARDNGVQLRPGMTIRINNVPTLSGFFLITGVNFSEQKTDPVSVEFRTPERLKVNGKEPKIPSLPIGKIFESEYYTKRNRLGQSTVGLPIFNETEPRFVSAGTTINPTGPQSASALPSARRPYLYPVENKGNYEFSLLGLTVPTNDIYQIGNIDLWNRPLALIKNGLKSDIFTTLLYPKQYSSYDNGWVLIERIWCNSGNVVVLSKEDAATKFETEVLHHGIFSTEEYALKFLFAIVNQQKEIIKKRFPNSYELILAGTAKIDGKC